MTEKNGNLAVVGTMEVKDVKKTQPLAAPKNYDAAVTRGSITQFIGDVKAEFKKITWTSLDELQVYTKVVVATTFFFGIGIYIVDLLIQSVLSGLGVVVSWVS